jgi:hypothetical protein
LLPTLLPSEAVTPTPVARSHQPHTAHDREGAVMVDGPGGDFGEIGEFARATES